MYGDRIGHLFGNCHLGDFIGGTRLGEQSLASAQAQASAITASIQAAQAQIQTLTDQVTAADYRLSQLTTQIAANQKQVASDQVVVNKDESQLRVQAITDYTSSGTSNQMTQMFSSSPNTSGIRSEYSSIATGNVTTTIDKLHSAQAQLKATQDSLEQAQSQAQTTRNSEAGAESQATALANQDQAQLDSVNSTIQADIAGSRLPRRRRPRRRPPPPSTPGWPSPSRPGGPGFRRRGDQPVLGRRGHSSGSDRSPAAAGAECLRCHRRGREPDRGALRLGR